MTSAPGLRPVSWLRTTAAAVSLVGLAVAVAMLSATGMSDLWDLPLRDAVLRAAPHQPPTAVAAVTIDEAALAREGPWPWPRERLAQLVRTVRENGAATVVLDVLLVEPAAGDESLAAALAAGPSITVAAISDDGTRWLLPTDLLGEAVVIAHAGFPLDHDGVLRRLLSTQQAGSRSLPAVAVAAASQVTGRAVPIAREMLPDFRVRTTDVPRLSAVEVLDGTFDPSVLLRRAVFVGSSALGLGDRVVTPTSLRSRPVPGVLVHAAATEAVITDHLLRSLPPWASGLLAVAVVVAACGCARLGGATRIAVELCLVGAMPALGGAALLGARLELPVATLTLVGMVAVGVNEGRLAWLGWRRSGQAAALLVEPGAEASDSASPSQRFADLERLARAARQRREDEAEARRVLAHELKTPLTSVRGLAQLLSEFDLPPEEQRRVAKMVGGEVDRLRDMVDGILDLARLREQPPPTSAVDLAAAAQARSRALAAGSGRSVTCSTPPTAFVKGERSLLERVLDNLIGNAIKYSPAPGEITVGVITAAAEVILEVRDRGPGIPPSERRAIFQRFVRGTTAAGTKGTGLGLALVDEVITWHGGHVDVVAGDPIGTTFRVVLPAATATSGG